MPPLNYYHRLWRLYRHYRRRDIVVPALPLRLWVEMSARCNLSCVMCPNKDFAPEEKGDMSWDVFRRTIDEAAGFAFDIALHHRGESLLHPQAAEFINYACRSGRTVKLHTNATLLTPELAEVMIAAGLQRLSISFDGFVAEEYEKVRRGADFNGVRENIRRLLALRNERNKRFPRVALEVIALSQGQLEREKQHRFLEWFGVHAPDELVVKKPHNWAGFLHTPVNRRRYAPCTFLWNAMLVLWNGDVAPCAQDFFATYIIGNVQEKSLREIWNDEPQQRLRRGLKERRPEDFAACTECDRLWRDTIMGLPREYLKQLLFRRMP